MCIFFGHSKPRFRGIWKNMGKVGTLFCACYTPGKRYVSFLLLLYSQAFRSGACRNVIGADSGKEPNREAPTKYTCMGEIVRPLSATGGERLAPLGGCPPFGALKTLKPLLHVWKYVEGVSKWQRSERRYVSNPPNSPRSPRALFSFLFYFMSLIGDFFFFLVFAPLSF